MPESIGNLSNLGRLYLNDNSLESFIINVNNFNDLGTIRLNNNQLTSLPDSLCDNPNVDDHINVGYNKLCDEAMWSLLWCLDPDDQLYQDCDE